jgi:DNA-directed RNA polymerase subunit RPC12/RpoP
VASPHPQLSACDCARYGVRVRRDLIRRITCYAVYRCERCGQTWKHHRWTLAAFGKYAVCLRCYSRELTRLKTVDRLDERSKNPLRWILRTFGAPLYHCSRCRFQFPDVRKLDPGRRRTP